MHLNAIPHHQWADYAFSGRVYGQSTSNLVKQQNFVFPKARELPVLDMLLHIWQDQLNKVLKEEKAPAQLWDLSQIKQQTASGQRRIHLANTMLQRTSRPLEWSVIGETGGISSLSP